MEEKEIKKIIEENEKLRQQNEELRKLLNRREMQYAFPDSIIEKYPLLIGNVFELYENRRSGKKYSAYGNVAANLSMVIRASLFPESKEGRKYVSVEKMERWQYQIFLNTVDKMLSALNDGRKAVLDNGAIQNNDDSAYGL